MLLCLLCLALPGTAAGQTKPAFSGFHSVLGFGEGESTSPQDLTAFEAVGTVPPSDLNQDQQYEGLEQAWPGFAATDLGKYYKDSDFQPAPSASTVSGLLGQLGTVVTGSPPAVERPSPGVLIVRDSQYQVPRIYGNTRAEAMWGAGYATAEDRLFLMDVLRHTAEGTTAELLGPSAAPADSVQLGLQDDSPAQLSGQMQSLPRTMGAEGSQALGDIKQYVAGINAFIGLTRINPERLPAEYPALGITPQRWTLADSAAVGVYLIGQFTVFGGQQPQQAEALRMAAQRLGRRAGTAVYNDLRQGADPEAAVTIPRRFSSNSTGPVNPRSEALIDPGSLVPRNARSSATTPAVDAPRTVNRSLPAWAQRLASMGLHLPRLESNAVLVDAERSGTGEALAAMGPRSATTTPRCSSSTRCTRLASTSAACPSRGRARIR